jgi:hypothetical protein
MRTVRFPDGKVTLAGEYLGKYGIDDPSFVRDGGVEVVDEVEGAYRFLLLDSFEGFAGFLVLALCCGR